MTKLTNELKAKFFALYWGQFVGRYKTAPDVKRMVYFGDGIHEFDYIALKPLSAISDEEAIECGFQQCTDEDSSQYGMSPSAVFLDDLEIHGFEYLLFGHDVDYLRSRGYALPYLGVSVEQQIEAGWIKLIEL